MSLPSGQQNIQQIPIKLVGGNKFGRYPKISVEETFNMIVSDNALVDYSGYKSVITVAEGVVGRGAHASSVKNIIIVVMGNTVYKLDSYLNNAVFIGILATNEGQVYIAENNGGQIAITDGVYLYIYNYLTPTTPLLQRSDTFVSPTFSYTNPGFISFQNGRFILALPNTSTWVLSDFNDGTKWPNTSQTVGSLQTKPDFVQACIPVPGRGGTLFVFGRDVVESWVDYGLALFPYQKNTSFNIDYGVINPASIAYLETYIVWLSANESSGLSLMVSDGGSIRQISTDGIDFKLGNLTAPDDCTGFLFRQDGHLLYQFTFITDNLSYVYDFNTSLFFTVTDEHLNYHIARQIVFFNNFYYFISINDGNFYQFSTNYTYLGYPGNNKQMPRMRFTAPVRFPNNKYYVAKQLQFLMENGLPNNIQTISYPVNQITVALSCEDSTILCAENNKQISSEAIEQETIVTYPIASEKINLQISIDGGINFGNQLSIDMNPTGKRRSLIEFKRLGMYNDCTYKLTYNGYSRVVIEDGILEAYQ